MAIHAVEHVREHDGDYFVGATRVTLGSAMPHGNKAESVRKVSPRQFPFHLAGQCLWRYCFLP